MLKGQLFEILPAYDMETGARTRIDEIARCQAEFIEDAGADVLAYVAHIGEVYVPRSRIRPSFAA